MKINYVTISREYGSGGREVGRKLAEKLGKGTAERLARMKTYRATAEKYDACILRMAYLFNEAGDYDAALAILTGRRFHVWEGADGLLAPFVEACIGLGRAAMAKGDYKAALGYFEESTTYPDNLQAGRPGDAGTEPKSRYFMAQCRKALGDAAGYRTELEKSLKGWIHAGEMDYWRGLSRSHRTTTIVPFTLPGPTRQNEAIGHHERHDARERETVLGDYCTP